jgi:Flp pilus assembly protein TadG
MFWPRFIRKFLSTRDGTSAVEFAIIFPVFLVVVVGLVVYGAYFGVVHGVQQLTAEAVRASIAGLNDGERLSLARGNIDANVSFYPMLSPARLSIQSAATDPVTSTFTVTVSYDASDLFIFLLPNLVPAPDPVIVRTAAIQKGGY